MDSKITELYNDYIHGDMPRRSFLKQLAVITAGHGFHNDTSQARYDEPAASLSWQRTINFFNHYFKS